MNCRAPLKAIAFEALFQVMRGIFLSQGVILQRENFLQLAIPAVINPEILIDNWHHFKGLLPFGRVGPPVPAHDFTHRN